MSGSSTMKQSDLTQAFALSTKLFEPLTKAESLQCQSELWNYLHITQGVPVGVGSGRSSLKYKMHASCHSLKLFCAEWRNVAFLWNSTVSIVGDLGESKVVNFRSNLKDMFGDWIVAEDESVRVAEAAEPFADEFQVDDLAEDFAEEPAAFADEFMVDGQSGDHHERPEAPDYPSLADQYMIDTSRAVYISGPHHILHNLQEGFSGVLGSWSWFMNLLKHVCRLLTNRWTKDRLISHCFSNGAATAFTSGIRSFHSKVYDARWGLLQQCIQLLGNVFAWARLWLNCLCCMICIHIYSIVLYFLGMAEVP